MDRFESVFEALAASPKKKLVCIATTANVNNPPLHIGAVRHTPTTIAANFVLKDLGALDRIIARYDGLADCFLVDCEVKDSVGALHPHVFRRVRKSAVRVFKPNDVTVEALDAWLGELVPDWSGRRAAIVGVGNIGSKIALKLAERGAEVALAGRDLTKIESIAAALRPLIRGDGRLTVAAQQIAACTGADVLLGCTPGTPAITAEAVEALPASAAVIDVGNGTLTPAATSVLHRRGMRVFCLSPNSGYQGLIARWEAAQAELTSIGMRKIDDELTLVSVGMLGPRGAVIVDDIARPSRIIGVCDGRGDVLTGDDGNRFRERFERYAHGK